jgi:hypothetical protein
MARALGHVLSARFALELPVHGAEKRVVETAIARLSPGLVHSLGVENVANAHPLDLLRGQEPELDLPDGADRRTRVREDKIRHFDVA